MKIFTSARYAFGALAAAVILGGCNSGALQTAGLGSSLPSATRLDPARSVANTPRRFSISPLTTEPVTEHPDHRASWVSPDVKKTREVLFASDPGTDDVYMYTLPGLELKGTITGFDNPEGECNDSAGNVWVVSQGSSPKITKLSHAGKILKILADPTGYPSSCAVDPTTGNLAVTNIGDLSSTPGDVLIYADAKGTPTVVSNPSTQSYYFAGYDDGGNLFVDGLTKVGGGSFVLSECAAGCVGATMTTISISGGPIDFPGFVQWYAPGGYLAVGDQECKHLSQTCVYAVSISSSSGTITGTIALKNSEGKPVCDMAQGIINPVRGKNLLGGDYEHNCKGVNAEYNWPFPAGGSPTHSNDGSQISTPVGAAISVR